MIVRKLSVADKLVLAARSLEADQGGQFTAEDLVVRAWELFGETFGLRGHIGEDGRHLYPDSNRVFAEIMGNKPLRSKGLLERTANKTYRLTSAGRGYASSLDGVEEGVSKRASLGRPEITQLRRYLGARAVTKLRDDRLDAVSFTDACSFWGISPGTGDRAFEARRAQLLGIVAAARDALRGADSAALDNSGKAIYTSEQLEQLESTDRRLQEIFVADISIIRARKDER